MLVFSWSMIANLISSESSKTVSQSTTTPSSTSTRSSPKDRLKAFTLEFDESVRIQQACAVPDFDLKSELLTRIKETILPPYILFYNQNQSLFTSSTSTSSRYHDPDQVENSIAHLFQG